MSVSAPSRVPLNPLPLSRFIPPANTLPSPISLPSKRNAPATSAAHEKMKSRKILRMDGDGHEVVRRSGIKEVTPRAKAVLERDDLGVGRSPARRLFFSAEQGGPSGLSCGISGAVSIPSTSPAAIPSRPLAAPSPIELSPYASLNTDSEMKAHIVEPYHLSHETPSHDPGFVIFADDTADAQPRIGACIGTPKSKRTTTTNTTNNPPLLSLDAEQHIPSSASSSRSVGTIYDEDQENIPPANSVQSTPSKRSARHAYSKSEGSDWELEETHHSSGGSGRRRLRTMERSKLGLESVLRGEVPANGQDDEDELTPGRREALEKDRGRGKARMTQEVDRI